MPPKLSRGRHDVAVGYRSCWQGRDSKVEFQWNKFFLHVFLWFPKTMWSPQKSGFRFWTFYSAWITRPDKEDKTANATARLLKTDNWEWTYKLNQMSESEVRRYGVLMNSFHELEPAYSEHYRKARHISRCHFATGTLKIKQKENI